MNAIVKEEKKPARDTFTKYVQTHSNGVDVPYVFAFVVTEAVTMDVCSFTLEVVDMISATAQTSPLLFVQHMKTTFDLSRH